jgi:hypothetical protein
VVIRRAARQRDVADAKLGLRGVEAVHQREARRRRGRRGERARIRDRLGRFNGPSVERALDGGQHELVRRVAHRNHRRP